MLRFPFICAVSWSYRNDSDVSNSYSTVLQATTTARALATTDKLGVIHGFDDNCACFIAAFSNFLLG
jgi:hypothetical protein